MSADKVWLKAKNAREFIEGTRNGIPYAAEQIDTLIRVARKGRSDLSRILDLGCGDGLLGRSLMATFDNASCVFVDFSPTMIEMVTAKVEPIKERATIITADLADPAWLDGVGERAPFDVVVSGFAIHHLEDARKKELYSEIYSLLAPGGNFLNLEHVKSASVWTEELFKDAVQEGVHNHYIKSGVNKTREEVEEELAARRHDNILATVEDQAAWLREIGYIDVDCFFRIFELALFGGRRPPPADGPRALESR